jgi:hypothetical protein
MTASTTCMCTGQGSGVQEGVLCVREAAGDCADLGDAAHPQVSVLHDAVGGGRGKADKPGGGRRERAASIATEKRKKGFPVKVPGVITMYALPDGTCKLLDGQHR